MEVGERRREYSSSKEAYWRQGKQVKEEYWNCQMWRGD